MNLSALLTSSLALLAFVVAFYALLAKERKTPYITRSIYRLAFGVIVAVVLILLAEVLEAWTLGIGVILNPGIVPSPEHGVVPVSRAALYCAVSGISLLLLMIIGILLNIWRLHNRDVYLVDQVRLRDFAVIRWIRYHVRRIRRKGNYEYQPLPIEPEEVHSALRVANLTSAGTSSQIRMMAICNVPSPQYDAALRTLTYELLKKNWRVQYTTCCRHPFEFIQALHHHMGDQWTRFAPHLVVVDAYGPHFGFSDSVHREQRNALRNLNVESVSSAKSYAGIHTAITRAFHVLKSKSNGQIREPALMIYEGCGALVDLESPEQYRIFLRHVIPSERMWGGMVTLFIEPTIGEKEGDLLKSYADLAVFTPPIIGAVAETSSVANR